MMYGYGGHILRVDLDSGKIIREKTDPDLMLEVIGGRGLNSRRLFDELKREPPKIYLCPVPEGVIHGEKASYVL